MTAPDDDDELDGFDGLHAMIGAARASGFDEEPAPRIDAMLMAAARAHAPRPRAAWWARLADWMRPAFAHPALAGAAALVIVGGAAGVMYRRGLHHPAAPPAPPTSQASRGSAAPIVPDLPPPHTIETQTPPEEVLQPELPRPHGEKRTTAGRTTPTSRPGSSAGSSAPPPIDRDRAGGGASGLMIAAGPVEGTAMLEPKDEQAAGEDEEARVDGLAAQLGVTPEATGNTLPEGRAPIVTSRPPTERGAVVMDDKPANTDDREGRVQAEQLLGQARTAARAKNCGAVKVIAARVRRVDATYFRDVFVRDPDVTRCK